MEARRVLPDAQNNRVASMVTGSWGRVDKNAEANCSPDKHNPFPLAKNLTNTVFAWYDLKKKLENSKATLILASILASQRCWQLKRRDRMKDSRSNGCRNGLNRWLLAGLLPFLKTRCTHYFWCEKGIIVSVSHMLNSVQQVHPEHIHVFVFFFSENNRQQRLNSSPQRPTVIIYGLLCRMKLARWSVSVSAAVTEMEEPR